MLVLRYVPCLVLGLCLAPSALGASDEKLYPGTLCVEDFDAAPEIYYMDGGAWNHNGSHAKFWCPIIRDNVSGDPSGPSAVTVDVWDGHTSAGVTCSIARVNGAIVELYGTDASIWDQKNYIDRLDLGGVPSADLHNRQNLNLFCVVAAMQNGSPSGILDYFVRER